MYGVGVGDHRMRPAGPRTFPLLALALAHAIDPQRMYVISRRRTQQNRSHASHPSSSSIYGSMYGWVAVCMAERIRSAADL